MDNNADLLTAALEYAAAGFRVFPLAAGDKNPITQHGFHDATTDKEQIRRWWKKRPRSNIGIATGETTSGKFLTVIDLDKEHTPGQDGFAELYEWQKENGVLPETLTAKTGGGGNHLYFFTEKPYGIDQHIFGEESGIDVRGVGGYIVAPPSVHKSGRRYEWTAGFDPSQIAQGGAVLDKLLSFKTPREVKPENSAEKPKKRAAKTPALVPLDRIEATIQRLELNFSVGSRNHDLFSLASSLQAQGYADSAIFDIVTKVNAERCSEPLPEKELETIIRSATEHYSKGIPRTLEAAGGDIAAYTERLAEKFPYIIPHERNGSVYYTVSTQLLAAHVRKNEHYFFLDTGGEKPPAFWYERGCYRRVDDNTFKGYIKRHIERFDEQLVISRDLDEVYKLLLTDGERVRLSEVKAENYICFKNGILSLDTLELLPHSSEIPFTVQIPCDWIYGSGAVPKCPRFIEFLETLTSGNKDMQVLLWEYIGLVISNVPGYIPKKALFLYGAGNTGKSQLLELLKRLIGAENYASTDIKELEENRFAAFALWNKRLAGSPDMAAMKVDELKLFKKLTGGDDIPFEAKGKDRFTDKFRGALMFCVNELPKFGGDKGDHVYERMLLCPCTNVIPPEKRDRQLIDKLYAEREGIVFNAVQALLLLRRHGYSFTEPAACQRAVDAYKTDNDNVLQFLDECTTPREELNANGHTWKTSTAYIYSAYREWCTRNGLYVQSAQEFRKSVCRRYRATDPTQLERKYNGTRYYIFDLNEAARNELLNYSDGRSICTRRA